MTRATRTYRYSLTANQVVILPNEGGYYKILEATGPVSVSRDGNTLDGLTAGQGERENFKRLSIQDQSGAANNIRIVIADASFVDDTIYGQVQVVDGGRLITTLNSSYIGAAYTGPSVGNFSCVQLWNPAGNTKRAAISGVIVSGFGASTMQLRPHNAALTTLGNIPQPKLVNTGFSNSTMEMRLADLAAIPGGTIMGQVFQTSSFAFQYSFKEPIILQPGQGLVVANNQVNTPTGGNFDFYEFTP